MKQIIFSAIVLIMFSITLSAQDKKTDDKKKKSEEITFIVGMHCQSCKERIEKIIPFEKGVKDINVNLEKKEVTVFFNPQKTSIEKLEQTIKDLGYETKVKPISQEIGSKNTSL
jgi:copper chaperone CopZ